MIKSSELRIGNLVNLKGQDCTYSVCMIEESGSLFFKEIPERYYDLEDDPVIGIPITPEWLERMGFTASNEIWTALDCDCEIIEHSGGSYRLGINIGEYEIGRYFQYVHELQNLCFALTGQELTIKQSA